MCSLRGVTRVENVVTSSLHRPISQPTLPGAAVRLGPEPANITGKILRFRLRTMDGMAQELSISNTPCGRGRGGTSDIVGPALSIIFCVIDGMFVMPGVGIGCHCSGCYCPHILSPNSQSPLRRKYVASHKGFLWTDCNSRFQPLLSALSPL